MRAVLCRTLDGPGALVIEDVDDPVPGPGQVLIDVQAAGINFPDGLIVSGLYQAKPPLPFIPGSELAGTVAAVGDGVTDLPIGTAVAAYVALGGYAEKVVADRAAVFVLPAGLDPVVAAVVPVVYGTTLHALTDRAQLAAGERLLVLGAAGGVGLAAVQLGKALGVTVIAAASTAEKLQLAAGAGADELINYRDEDLAGRLKELAPRGVDVVYDPVGGPAADAAVRRLAWHGRYLTIGYTSGTIPAVPLNRLLLNEASVSGVFWGAWAGRNPAIAAQQMGQVLDWCADGTLNPVIGLRAPLAEAAGALAAVMGRQTSGKAALLVGT